MCKEMRKQKLFFFALFATQSTNESRVSEKERKNFLFAYGLKVRMKKSMISWKVSSGGAGSSHGITMIKLNVSCTKKSWNSFLDGLPCQALRYRKSPSFYPWQIHNTKLIAQKLILNYRHFAFRVVSCFCVISEDGKKRGGKGYFRRGCEFT